MGSPKSGKALLKAAHDEAEPEARAAMLVAAGLSGDSSLAKALEGYLTNSSESARLAAAQGLCVLGARAGTDFAAKLLTSTDPFERLQGLKLYEGGKAKTVSKVLLPLLDGPDLKLGAVAARMLVDGGDANKVDWLVIKSFLAKAEDKLIYENELEPLRLTDAQRSAILKKANLK
jgi:HEAT repeat protein